MIAYRISLCVFLAILGMAVILWVLTEVNYQGRRHRNITRGLGKEADEKKKDKQGDTQDEETGEQEIQEHNDEQDGSV